MYFETRTEYLKASVVERLQEIKELTPEHEFKELINTINQEFNK
jgi:hypothetical protein